MSSTLEPAVEPSPAPSGATFHPMHSQGDSIVDFVKYMIGCNEGNHPLPPQPTIIEMHICEEFNATHGVQYQLPAYLPSDLLVHSKFTPAAKNRCDLDFHVKGFSRITFEWKKPSLTDSSWNRTTVDILCDHYGMWVLNEQSTTNDFSPVNGKSAVEEWLVSRQAKLTQKRTKMAQGEDIVDPDFEENDCRHTLYCQKVSFLVLRFKLCTVHSNIGFQVADSRLLTALTLTDNNINDSQLLLLTGQNSCYRYYLTIYTPNFL
ncbi:hypothetical protein MJO29_011837 [Puccinia striiformis f. sp. tritici]|uniref:Uncharacterized protein n=2 Tax=Puccinia striiformis TaxID=27350 RepID=A0A0L0VYY1_9BASI|nr:hypothetical protein MJO29_011837 [Puccinia striiformis f. sp. tritici]KAI9611189.1 hypothetical protein KEM48_004661 [Puccinia striiformis f. sp. tritici PST-130]KNF04427.1 hypothetical protein PSTG_02342 [Puccinia striiformis f. sp. tritici PST-78]POW15808.1 hypothetical protein PSHT_07037 [Puccinia striiformis]